MTIHVLVEGTSEVAFLDPWVRRLLKGYPVRVHPHEGKGSLPRDLDERPAPRRRGLLDQLPAKLRGFANAARAYESGVVVLVDADGDDPVALRKSIEEAAEKLAPGLKFVVQVAVEETEAFYLGDLRALERAYPEADMDLAAAYEPDSICGTLELFGRVIHDGGENKLAWAEKMGPLVTTAAARSRSPSFRGLLTALRALVPVPAPAKKKRKWRHPPRTEKRR